MPVHHLLRWFAAFPLVIALGGCTGTAGVYRVENASGQPIPPHALADDVFLDGTGPSARMLARTSRHGNRRHAKPQHSFSATRTVGAAPFDRAENVIGTTGARSSSTQDAKSFQEWVEDEKRQDARMRTIMNICRGC